MYSRWGREGKEIVEKLKKQSMYKEDIELKSKGKKGKKYDGSFEPYWPVLVQYKYSQPTPNPSPKSGQIKPDLAA